MQESKKAFLVLKSLIKTLIVLFVLFSILLLFILTAVNIQKRNATRYYTIKDAHLLNKISKKNHNHIVLESKGE